MANNRISIITPTLNQGKYLEKCIDSVLSQKYKNLQYIIIDGGSSDESIQIIKKYEKHLDYWVSEPDNGQSHALNKGLKKVTGNVFNWINSDDFLENDSLQFVNEAFQDRSTNVFSARSNLIKDGEIIGQSKGLDLYPNNLAKTIGLARIDQPETYWRKEVLDQIGLLNPNLHFIMDRDWWVRYLLKYGLSGINKSQQVIANFRLHDDSKTVSQSDSFNKERNQYFKTMAYHYQSNLNPEILSGLEKIKGLDFPKVKNKDILSRAINYFIYQLAQEQYEMSEFRLFNETVQHLNTEILEEKDQVFVKKIKLRAQVIPSLIHKNIKRFR